MTFGFHHDIAILKKMAIFKVEYIGIEPAPACEHVNVFISLHGQIKHDFSTECTIIVFQIYIINLPGPYLAAVTIVKIEEAHEHLNIEVGYTG